MTGNIEALSEREKETLRLLLQGHDAKSIARHLGLSVHTVNERLRASRRKLDASSSREAARLLALSEQRTPNSVVDKQIGVAGDAVAVNNDRRRNGPKGVEHPIVLATGGTLTMSLIIAAAMLTWVASRDTQLGPRPNWSVATAAPEKVAQPRNSIQLDGNRLLWNGKETSEARIRQYLNITTEMNPQPLVILSYSAQTPPDRIQRAKLLIDEEIPCTPGNCLEITLSPASPSPSAASTSAQQWVALVDAQRWQESWQSAGTVFKSQTTASTFAASVDPVRKSLGRVSKRAVLSATKHSSLPGMPPGQYEIVEFRTDFANRKGAIERVVLAREGSAWKVIGYFFV